MTDTEPAARYPDELPPGTIPPDGTPLGALVHVLSVHGDRPADTALVVVGTRNHYVHTPGVTHQYVEGDHVFTGLTWGDLRKLAEDAQP